MVYGDFQDLIRRTVSDKTLHDKAFNIVKNLKYGYQKGLTWMVCNIFDKKSASGAVTHDWLVTSAMLDRQD